MRRSQVLFIFVLSLSFQVYAQEAQEIHDFIDQWHLAASRADEEAFFGAIADDGIYIGTDAHERWTKTEFLAFAKPYFDRGQAWDFKPRERDIHQSADGRLSWFSELLDTWMGVCRGSGVLEKTASGWKIRQYHLSVTVPNEVIRDFIKLIDGHPAIEKK